MFTSASRTVFIVIGVTACIAFLYGVFTYSVDDGLPVDQFMILAGNAFTYYFSTKSPKVLDQTQE